MRVLKRELVKSSSSQVVLTLISYPYQLVITNSSSDSVFQFSVFDAANRVNSGKGQ